MPFPYYGVLDSGTRANEGPPPSGAWLTGIYAADNGWSIATNKFAPEVTGSNKSSLYSDRDFPALQEIYASIDTFPTTGDSVELWLNIQNPDTATPSGYCLRFWHHTGAGVGALELDRVDGGSNTRLHDMSKTLTATNQLGLRNDNGTLRVFVAGTEEASLASADTAYFTSGFLGIRQLGSTGTATRLSNFGGGSSIASRDVFLAVGLERGLS